ncbi:hypothetical protein LINPERPRIM_LOCUS26076 [Linum perenne]
MAMCSRETILWSWTSPTDMELQLWTVWKGQQVRRLEEP